jgi:hypothetical protein
MLSKCASPGCSNVFRYLHEGKLYLIDFKAALIRRKYPAANTPQESKAALEYAWLCADCARDLTIYVDPDAGICVVHRQITQDGPFETRSQI